MGFRSTFTTSDYTLTSGWPEWFVAKYQQTVHLAPGRTVLSARFECKEYAAWPDLAEDIQRALGAWFSNGLGFEVVFLHECGGVTRCEIRGDSIAWTEPETWERVGLPTHRYCYGCSDAAKAEVHGEVSDDRG